MLPISSELIAKGFNSFPSVGTVREKIIVGIVRWATVLLVTGIISLSDEMMGSDGLGFIWRLGNFM